MIAGLFVAAVQAWAQGPAVVIERQIAATPAEVYRVAADLGVWSQFWAFDGPGGAESGFVSRGRPLGPHQALRWSSGPAGSGEVVIHDVEPPGQVVYSLTWTRRPLVDGLIGAAQDHVGSIRIEPSGEGSALRWELFAAAPPDRRRPVGRVEHDVERAVDRLAALVADSAALPVLPAEPPSAERSDLVLVWRGFSHRWTYNHRVNRNGDLWTMPTCGPDGCTTESHHAAASGSGADRATYTSAATALSGPDLAGWYGEIVLWFDGKEGESLTDRDCVTLPAEVGEGPALMRGWDLDAVGDADSLWALEFGLSRDRSQVCATGALKMACRTPECAAGARTTYSLDLPFVVATGPGLRATTHRQVHAHEWLARDLRDEPDPTSGRVAIDLPAVADRPAVLGLAGVSIALDKPLHLRGFDVGVGVPTRDPVTGSVRADLDLFVAQWGPVEIAPLTVAQFAEAGRADLAVDLVLVQPESACAVDLVGGGTHFWGGQAMDASVDAAVAVREIAVPTCAP